MLPDNGAGMCEERYSGRKEAFDELDGAETLKGLLQKEVSMFLAGLDPHQLSQEVQCPFCPWFRVKKIGRGPLLARIHLPQRGAPLHVQWDQATSRYYVHLPVRLVSRQTLGGLPQSIRGPYPFLRG